MAGARAVIIDSGSGSDMHHSTLYLKLSKLNFQLKNYESAHRYRITKTKKLDLDIELRQYLLTYSLLLMLPAGAGAKIIRKVGAGAKIKISAPQPCSLNGYSLSGPTGAMEESTHKYPK